MSLYVAYATIDETGKIDFNSGCFPAPAPRYKKDIYSLVDIIRAQVFRVDETIMLKKMLILSWQEIRE